MQTAFAQVCTTWKTGSHIGTLETPVDEASGVAASRKFPGRLYHINDSGDDGRFYVTDADGKNTKAVRIDGFRPFDAEALSLGPCGANRSCLFIGDIGDNNRKKDSVEIIAIDEVENFPATVKPRQRIKLKYPDTPHDAESMAVHPNGTIFILTKENPARLFKADVKAGTMNQVMSLELGGVPTDMAISDDGTRLVVLTYLDATEFGIDFERFGPPRYRQKIPIQFLQQEESITYLPGSRSFIYTTESLVLPAWIMRVDCTN